MKLIILGTGNAMAKKCYNTCFAIENKGKYLLVDGGGGNGIFTQLDNAGIRWNNITDIFVTHKHVDHIMGIVWMIRLFAQNMSSNGFDGTVNIYGHSEVIDILKQMADMLLIKKQTAFIGKQIILTEVADGEEKNILNRKCTFFDVQSTKDKQFGFTMDIEDGQKITCCGDEPYSPCEEKYVRGSKWLLHEAFCLDGQADIFKPYEKHHSTVASSCNVLSGMDVKNLILYHTEDKNIDNRKELYLAEGEPLFDGRLYVPDDLEVFEL